MSRLLQGDVGAGKTVVAAMAALNVSRAGFQAAFMAPTEILAKQHFAGISKMLKDFETDVGLLTGKQGKIFRGKQKNTEKISRKELLEKIKKDEPLILIGTHALIQR